jgi:hypothetical protein
MTGLSKILAAVLGIVLSHAAAGKSPRETPPTQGYVRLQFAEHFKIAQDLQFTGTKEVKSVSFRLPSRLKPRAGSSLHVFLQNSKDLDADRSFLSVSLNHGILRSVRLDHQSTGLTEMVIPVPADMLTQENELAFFVEQFPRPSANDGKVWTRISPRSFLAIPFTEAPPELNLARLPAPMLEPHPYRETALSVLLPERFVPSTFEATALLLANLARRVAPERVQVRVVRSMHATRQPLLIVGTPTEQPQLARLRGRTVLGDDEGLVGFATSSQANANPILFVTANSSSAVLQAARSVLSPEWNVSGKVVRVAKEATVAPAKLREWPGFMPPRSLFTLADLGFKEQKIPAHTGDSLAVALNATPDAHFLNYGNRMVLKLRLNPDAYVGDARLLVQLNDVTLTEVVKESFRGSIASVPVSVPRSVLKPRNVLRIVWKGTSHPVNYGAVAWLLPSSEFYLPRYYETELPELGLLQFQLYPFSLKGDLSDVLVVLPDKLDEETFSALLELAVGFAQLAPAPHLAFRVRRLGDLTEADLTDFHLVFLNAENHPDRLTALLPGWKARPSATSFKRHPVIREMASPWNPQRYILIISAKSRQLHRAVSEGFSQSNLVQLRGDIAYLTAKRPESFVLGPRLKVTEYSYFLFMEAWLRAHWLALPIILIAVSGLLFVGVRLALRHYGSHAPLEVER